jgi:hypothetical protein
MWRQNFLIEVLIPLAAGKQKTDMEYFMNVTVATNLFEIDHSQSACSL